MKLTITAILIWGLSVPCFTQYLKFAPKGATWYIAFHNGPPGFCPPTVYHEFTLTKDTVIQGKYCTRLEAGDWSCDGGIAKPFVHDDNGKVYRYDFGEQTFQLVLDYTKKEGESWKVKVCPEEFDCDSLTVTVVSIAGRSRIVFVDYCTFSREEELLEGAGGLGDATKLLFRPSELLGDCPRTLLCYSDPVEGFVYGDGGASRCV